MAEKEKNTSQNKDSQLTNPGTSTGDTAPARTNEAQPGRGNEEDSGPNRIHSLVMNLESKESGPGPRRFNSADGGLMQSRQENRSPGETPQKNAGRGGGSPRGSRSPSFGVPRPASPSPSGFGGALVFGSQTTVNRRHRMSGLFSMDDLSIDISTTASDVFRPGLIEQAQAQAGKVVQASEAGGGGGGDKDKRHPMSIASSSIGSSSLGSVGDFPFGDERRRRRYRYFRRRWRRFRRKFKGVIFAIISSLTSSLASYFVHELTGSGTSKYSPSYCLLWRHLFGVLFPGIILVLYYRLWCKDMVFDTVWPLKNPEAGKRFGLSVARGVMDVISIFMAYEAYKYLMLSEASTIMNSKPIFVQLLAHFTLGEEWGFVPIIMSVVTAFGVLIMSKPPFMVPNNNPTKNSESDFVSHRLPGIGHSIGSMLISAVTYCILRSLKDVHYSVFSLFIGVAGVVIGLGLTFGLNEFVVPTSTLDIIYLIAIAGLVCISSICIVIALQNEEAFVVSLVRTLDVIFSFLWEMCLKQKYPDWYSGGGAFIIMFCVAVIFFRKYLYHQDPESKVYQMFIFLTK